jgi:phosphatidylglycerol:prolipoprotein diacylglycerol transferase
LKKPAKKGPRRKNNPAMFPKIIDLGAVTIHTYGLLLAAAFIFGIWITVRNGEKAGFSADLIWNMGLIALFSGLVGSKILLLFSNYGYYSKNPRQIFSLSAISSPMVYYGGLLLALGAVACLMWKKKIHPWIFADIAGPGTALGLSIASIGCLSAGCCYGKPTQLPWAITFTNPYVAENLGVPLHIPLHPTQIYTAAGSFILFLYLMWRLPRKKYSGQIILEFLGLYSILIFLLDFLRGDERGYVFYGLLSTNQLIAVITFIGSVFLYCILLRRPAKVTKN